jgi:hypothetical protein
MPTYSAIADATIAVNKPVTNSLLTLLRDNPLAIFQALGWLTTSKVYTSPEQTIAAAALLTLSHGLTLTTGTEVDVSMYLICKTAELGYSIGDIVAWNPSGVGSGAGNSAFGVKISTTQINIRFGSSGIVIVNFTNGTTSFMTVGNWRLIVKARG